VATGELREDAMIPLLPSGGIVNHEFGILTAPYHKGVPVGIVEGMRWGADLGVLDGPKWLKRFDPDKAFPWLGSMWKHKDTCMFIPVPDVYQDARKTIEAYLEWWTHMWAWPLAFIAQDGQEDEEFPLPKTWVALFVGGSTEWKLSDAAHGVIIAAQEMGKHIHIGRVNWMRRYRHFAVMEGSDDWTFDGTRNRFEGVARTMAAWAGYHSQGVLLRRLSDGDYRGESFDS
jgi:hypothetical protein